MTKNYSGKCACGAVTYTAYGPPVIVAQCHCDECRRISGTGHSVGAMFPVTSVVLTGELRGFQYTSDKGTLVTKGFCQSCGSPIYGKNSNAADHMTLTLGTFDDAHDLEVEVVIFERNKPHWDQLGPKVMSFATQPDWTPDA